MVINMRAYIDTYYTHRLPCYDTGRCGGSKQAWQSLVHIKEKKRVLSLGLKVGHKQRQKKQRPFLCSND